MLSRPVPRLSSLRSWSAPARGLASSSPSYKLPDDAVVFSGIQPTGMPHLGNWLGAMKQWVRLQNEAPPSAKLLYSIVDLHALTVRQDAAKLRQNRRVMLAAMLAVGLDPERSIIFYQSAVPAHSELMWLLSCTASTGYLSRMTQWKSKLNLTNDTAFTDVEAKTSLKLGLFSYPVLQAADILVHGATHVPVGEDQAQHLEFARECAGNFNAQYGGKHLIPPQTILSPAKRIMNLRNPLLKMSKSDRDARSSILLSDTPQQIRQKVFGAMTDSIHGVTYDPEERAGVANLLDMLSYLDAEGRSPEKILADMEAARSKATEGAAGAGTEGDVQLSPKDLKIALVEALNQEVGDVRYWIEEMLARDNGAWLDGVAEKGAVKARESAQARMEIVKAAVGL